MKDESGQVIGEIAQGIGRATNNVAEYKALVAGLELALNHGVTDIEIFSDSELVVSQLKGEWKIKSDSLRRLAVDARRLMNKFASSSIAHVPREENADADKLANQGMDEAEFDAELDAEAPPEQRSFYE
jgi:ribonuclease HI